MNKPKGFTKSQVLVLVSLAGILLFIFIIAAIFFLGEFKQNTNGILTINISVTSTNVLIQPMTLLATSTPIPAYVYHSTITPIPSPTSFVLPNDTTLQQPQSNPLSVNNSAVNPSTSSICSANLNNALALHEWYLDSIDYIHSPAINYYQGLINEYLRSRDAVGLIQAQNYLDNEKAQVKAEKASENRRYKAEVANIKNSCQ